MASVSMALFSVRNNTMCFDHCFLETLCLLYVMYLPAYRELAENGKSVQKLATLSRSMTT